MNIEIIDFVKNEFVEFKLDNKILTLNIDDYDLTEYSKRTLACNDYYQYQIDFISKTLKDKMEKPVVMLSTRNIDRSPGLDKAGPLVRLVKREIE